MPEPRLPTSRYQMLELHQIPRDENTFVDWLVDADAGGTLAYYRGHLAFDRDPQQSMLGEFRRLKLSHLADRAMECCERKQVLLVQRRMGKDDWVYLAIRTDEPLLRKPGHASHPSLKQSVRSLHHV